MMSLHDCEVRERSVLVRVSHLFLILQIRSHRMRTKPRAHTAIIYSCVILVIGDAVALVIGKGSIVGVQVSKFFRQAAMECLLNCIKVNMTLNDGGQGGNNIQWREQQ